MHGEELRKYTSTTEWRCGAEVAPLAPAQRPRGTVAPAERPRGTARNASLLVRHIRATGTAKQAALAAHAFSESNACIPSLNRSRTALLHDRRFRGMVVRDRDGFAYPLCSKGIFVHNFIALVYKRKTLKIKVYF